MSDTNKVWVNGKAYTSSQARAVVLLPDASEIVLKGTQKFDYSDKVTRAKPIGEGGRIIGKARGGKYEPTGSWSLLRYQFDEVQAAVQAYGLAQSPALPVSDVDFDILITIRDGADVIQDTLEKCNISERTGGYDNNAADALILVDGDLSPVRILRNGVPLNELA